MKKLSKAGKEEVALALILWKDFKAQGKFDIELTKMSIDLAKNLGVYEQYNALVSKISPMRIEPR